MPSAIDSTLVRIDQHGGVARDLGQRRHVRRHDRRAARHRLERRQAEPFVQRRERRTPRPVGRGPRASRPAGSRGSARACAACACARRVAAPGSFEISSPMMSSLRSSNPRCRSRSNASISRTRFLCGLMLPTYSTKPSCELVALADARDVLLGRLPPEAFVDGVVDDDDLFGRHVEEVQDVALRGFRHREDADATAAPPSTSTSAAYT